MYFTYLVTGVPQSPAFKVLQKSGIALTRHSTLPQSGFGTSGLDVLLIETEDNISPQLMKLKNSWEIQAFFVLAESYDVVHQRHFDSKGASLHRLAFGKM